MKPPDPRPRHPSSPSTSSARDAVVEAMAAGPLGFWPTRAHARAEAERMLDAALGVTYATPCPTCAEPNMALGTGPDYRDGCPSCNGSGRSAPRLALIDVLVAEGALEAAEYVKVRRVTRDFQATPPREDMTREACEPLYRIPSSKES